MSEHGSMEFESFARAARPRLVRAFAPVRGEEAADGAAEALAYAWEHWDRVGSMGNPIGYLYRVGQSHTRRRMTPTLPPPEAIGLPDVEPALIPALLQLPEAQRTAVWLVHACQWRYAELQRRWARRRRRSGITSREALLASARNWRFSRVLDIEDQLRRYGGALERHLEHGRDDQVLTAPPARRLSHRWLVAAAVFVIALGSATLIVTREAHDPAVVSTTPDAGGPRAGVFSTPTDTVLLFSDGIDGATAIDLDRRIAGRRVIEGERAGDQPFRLTLTGDHLVVGWGEIYAAPLAGGPSRKIADATIYIPASDPGEVWTLTWEGGRIGVGTATLQRVNVDGSVRSTSHEFDPSVMQPVIGVPGGIVVDTPNGIAVWDANTGSAGPVLGPGPARAASSDGRSLAWCESTCANMHVVSLARTGPPTAQHVAPGSQQLALSDDGTHLAFLRPAGERADLVIRNTNGQEQVVAQDLDPTGALQWSGDSRQLFYSEGSYGESTMRIGRYESAMDRWELRSIPVGDGLAPLALTRAEARTFFSNRLSPANDCRGANGSYPSGRKGTCTFAFSTPDSPDQCVAAGGRSITVPDGLGRPLGEAIIAMQQAGLRVLGTGTPEGDPTGSEAVVRAQEPPAGESVPLGSCIGFRTAR